MIIRSRSQALIVLQLDPDATDEVIKAAYKRLLTQHHPDKGGDVDRFDAVCRARDFLLRKRCSVCDGTKVVRTKNGRAWKVDKCTECL